MARPCQSVQPTAPACSDCDQPDEVRGPGPGRLAVRDQGREQQPGDLLRPQEEESGEEGRRETAAVGEEIVSHSYSFISM